MTLVSANDSKIWVILFSIFLLLIGLTYFVFHSPEGHQEPIINDGHVELLQTLYFDTHQLSYFAPTYPGTTTVSVIESFSSYLNKFFWKIFPETDRYIVTKMIYFSFHFFAFLLIGFLIFNSQKLFLTQKDNKFYIYFFSFLIILSTSAIFPYFIRVLTRNALSIFWSSLALLSFYLLIEVKNRKKMAYALLLISLIGGVWTYSSLKLFFMGLWITYLVFCLFHRMMKEFFVFGVLSIAAGGICLLSIHLGQVDIWDALQRGQYVYIPLTWENALKHFFQLIRNPFFYEDASRSYLMEVVHLAFNRSFFSFLLLPVYLLGVLNIFLLNNKKSISFFSLLFTIVGVLPFILCGPSLKYTFVNLPIYFIVLSAGWEFALFQICCLKFPGVIREWTMVSLFLSLFLYLGIYINNEGSQLFLESQKNSIFQLDINQGLSLTKAIEHLAPQKKPIIAFSPYSKDTTTYQTLGVKNLTIYPDSCTSKEQIQEIVTKEFSLSSHFYIILISDSKHINFFDHLKTCHPMSPFQSKNHKYVIYRCFKENASKAVLSMQTSDR
ncbi:MAG: hypothetical protein QE271_12495 [Bacteriovoracaceae bacterium]|nr:hypothetical protein [Bacteriovoracaceae bacterium]